MLHNATDVLETMKGLVVILVLVAFVECKDNFTINFIKSFVQSEGKPTHLIYNGLCWKNNIKVKLLNEVSKCGIRCSSSLKIKSAYQDHITLFLLDLECHESENVLLHATSQKLFQLPFRWLILSSRDVELTKSELWSRPLLIDSDLVLAENVGGKFLLTELYRLSLNTSTLSKPRGYFDGFRLFDVRPHKEQYRRRKDLLGHSMTMANVIQDSNDSKIHILKEDRLNLQHDAIAKIGWIAAKHAFEMLNATPRYIFSYRWGYKVNGRWSGMIEDLLTGRADVGTNIVMFADRMEVVTFTDVVNPLRLHFVFRQPPLTSVANIFSLPFSTSVWITLVVCVAASTATLYITSKFEASLETSAAQLDGSVGDALLLTLSAVAQQGCFMEPRRAPGRIMEFVLFAAMMALYAAYSANIVVLLQAPSNSIRTLAQLAASKINLGALDVDYSKFIINDTTDQAHIIINKRVFPENDKPELYNIYDGVERIRQGMFAFHSIVEPMYRRIEATFLETEKCDLTAVDYLNGFEAFTPVKKGSPYLEFIRVVYGKSLNKLVSYKQIREFGIRSALNHRYQVQKPRCSSKMAAFSSVGFFDLLPVIVFMTYGAALSVLILFAEIVYYKVFEECKKRNSRNHLIKRIKVKYNN